MPTTGQALPSTVETLVHVVVHDYAALHAKVRTWRAGLLLLGVLQIAVGQTLGLPLSIVLLIIGAASFLVQEAVVLLLFGIVLLGGALINISSLQLGYLPVALLQVGCAVLVLRCYARYRPAEERYARLAHGLQIGLPPPAMHASAALPWAGAVAGLLALGISMTASGAAAYGTEHAQTIVGLAQTGHTVLPLDLAVLGLALCVTPIAQRRPSALALLGITISMFVIGVWIVALLM